MASMSASVWDREVKPASNCEGARYTPSSSMLQMGSKRTEGKTTPMVGEPTTLVMVWLTQGPGRGGRQATDNGQWTHVNVAHVPLVFVACEPARVAQLATMVTCRHEALCVCRLAWCCCCQGAMARNNEQQYTSQVCLRAAIIPPYPIHTNTFTRDDTQSMSNAKNTGFKVDSKTEISPQRPSKHLIEHKHIWKTKQHPPAVEAPKLCSVRLEGVIKVVHRTL